jgi:hypothetical protein
MLVKRLGYPVELLTEVLAPPIRRAGPAPLAQAGP